MMYLNRIQDVLNFIDYCLASVVKKTLSLLPFLKFISSHLKLISLIISIIILTVVLQQSSFYRWFGYETIPAPTNTDEFNYVWQGLSLRSSGLPIGWVTFSYLYREPKYRSRGGNVVGFNFVTEGKKIDLGEFQKDRKPLVAVEQINYNKGLEYMFFAAPFFDHPPLGGLIYSLGEGKDVKEFKQVKPAEFRRPALVLATVTSVLLFIFIFLVTDNPWVGLLSAIIYSTAPTFLLATRTAFLENVEPPFILVHLIILFLAVKIYTNEPSRKVVYLLFILSGLSGGLAFLAKEAALGFLIGSTILLIINKISKKVFLTFVLAEILPIASYFIWGIWLQKDLFLDVLKANSERGYFGAIKLVTMLEALKFKDFPVDGWWVWGLLSFFIISVKIKQKSLLFLIIPLLFHLLLLLFLGSPNYPWYLISLIPFLAGCSAIVIWQVYEKPNIALNLVFFLIPFSSSYYWGRVALSLPPSIAHYRYTFAVFFFVFVLRWLYGKNSIVKIIWVVFWVLMIKKIYTFNQLFIPYLISHWGNLPVPSLPSF